MENVNTAEIITQEKQYESQESLDGWKAEQAEPAEHTRRNIDHAFNWKIVYTPSSQEYLRKNLEAIFIALYKPSLNDQKSFDRLMLFKNGIT